MSSLSYFRSSLIVTFVGLLGAFALGHYYTGTWPGATQMLFLCAVLAVLEVSLSFDNAVVNATVLRNMTPLWRHRFLTWGILIAVFGMRIVFPLAIVGIIAKVNPWDALVLAAVNPAEYARIMQSVHVPVAAFGGAFLLMVGLKYFFDHNKDVHWIRVIEKPLSGLGRLEGFELAIAMMSLYGISKLLDPSLALEFLVSGLFGLVAFILVDGVSALLEDPEVASHGSKSAITPTHKASAGMFLYLEVLDASFSFDGVVGAFAITNNLFLIAIGLGIGAMFVRSMTIMLVDQGTLTQYRYLEHGAFYAILALAAIMFVNTVTHIPEFITGLIGATLIGLSFWASILHNRKHKVSAA